MIGHGRATFVLVHGAWHGGWCYSRVTRLLKNKGYDVLTPTLTGLGERSHLHSGAINASTHVRDILNVIAFEGLDDVVLVGHSYGGQIITAVADASPDKIQSLVCLATDRRASAQADPCRDGSSLRRRRPGPRRSAPGATAIGALLVAGGAAAQGFGTVLIKRLGPIALMQLTAWITLLTAPQLAMASALIKHGQMTALHHAPLLAWLSLGYAVLFGAIAGFGLWFWLIARCSLARVAPFTLLQTVFGIAASVIFLGEPATVSLVSGALVCMAGVAITQTQPRTCSKIVTASS